MALHFKRSTHTHSITLNTSNKSTAQAIGKALDIAFDYAIAGTEGDLKVYLDLIHMKSKVGVMLLSTQGRTRNQGSAVLVVKDGKIKTVSYARDVPYCALDIVTVMDEGYFDQYSSTMLGFTVKAQPSEMLHAPEAAARFFESLNQVLLPELQKPRRGFLGRPMKAVLA